MRDIPSTKIKAVCLNNIQAEAASKTVFGTTRVWTHVRKDETVVVGLRVSMRDPKEIAKAFGLPESAVALSGEEHQKIADAEGAIAFTIKTGALLRTAAKKAPRAK